MSYAITTIWHERNRFLPAIMAVAFSALLIALQTGLLLGLLSMMSIPVDKASADVWVMFPGTNSVDLGRELPAYWESRVAEQPGVDRVETGVMGFGMWTLHANQKRPQTLTEVCMVVGTELDRNSIALVEPLRGQPDLVARLAEPMTVLIDESERDRLGVTKVGEMADVVGLSVRIVGMVKGLKSLGGAYVFCSTTTARTLLRFGPNTTTCILAKCKTTAIAARVVQRLKIYPQMTAYTKDEFSFRSRMHWMTTTKAGLALAFTACLGLVVGAVVTSQTLYAATVAAQREYATLRAMGIPRWRLKLSVVTQAFWVGLAGLLVAIPMTAAFSWFASLIGTQVRLPWFIVLPAAALTMGMALGSGLLALRSLQKIDPVHNIR
jgi:putative ABC transport system permease protein